MHDSLPNRDQDPVLTLYAHYFLAAELMRSNYVKLKSKFKQHGRLSRKDTVDYGIYFCTWLGFLGVTCEGFRKLSFRLLLQNNRPEDFRELIPKSDWIGGMIKQHADTLREFRNNVFHLRDDIGPIERFLANESVLLKWAEDLHTAFRDLFSGSESYVKCITLCTIVKLRCLVSIPKFWQSYLSPKTGWPRSRF